MKRVILAVLFLVFVQTLFAQQHSLYSQYIFNLYAINPAYAGSRDALSANLSYRAQWVGFEGAPKTQNFSVHSPLRKKNMAVGLQFQNDEIGARSATSISATYAYTLNLGAGKKINLGLQGGVINYTMDWNELTYDERNDPTAWSIDPNRWIPNFDFGAMYLTPRAYVGFSVVNLSEPSLSDSDQSDARLRTHLNLVGGKIFNISPKLDLKPGFLVRHDLGAAMQFDVSLSALLSNQFWFTATYRHNFGMVASAHVFITEKLHVGYAYDQTLNNMMTYQSGSHEIFVGYDMPIYKTPQIKPRFY